MVRLLSHYCHSEDEMASIRRRNGKWQVQVRRHGLNPQSKTFHNRSDALQWARETEVEADRGNLNQTFRTHAVPSLFKAIDRYLNEVTPRKKSADAERYVLRAFQRQKMCQKPINEVRTADFVGYRESRLSSVSPSGLRRELNSIRHVFETARNEWGIPLGENPISRLRIVGADQSRTRRLIGDEKARLLNSAAGQRNPFLAPIIRFALETAMRRGELLALRWDDIDTAMRVIAIRSSKNGHSRSIPLSNEALKVIRGLANTQNRVFPISTSCLRMAWDRLTRKAKLHDLHFHDLRHEAISRYFEKGLTVPEVASISGHREIRMLLRYAHAEQTRVVDKLDSSL